MAAGKVPSALDVNDRVPTLVRQVWLALDQARDLYLQFNDANHNDAYWNGLGITGSKATPSTDLGKLFASIADIGGDAGLWATAHGKFHPAANNDFFANGYLLTGLDYTGSAQ